MRSQPLIWLFEATSAGVPQLKCQPSIDRCAGPAPRYADSRSRPRKKWPWQSRLHCSISVCFNCMLRMNLFGLSRAFSSCFPACFDRAHVLNDLNCFLFPALCLYACMLLIQLTAYHILPQPRIHSCMRPSSRWLPERSTRPD